MANIFLSILNISITASYIALAAIVLRMLLKRNPKWITCILWALLAIRLLVPFSFESKLSLIPSAEPVKSEAVISSAVENNYQALMPQTPVIEQEAPDSPQAPVIEQENPDSVQSPVTPITPEDFEDNPAENITPSTPQISLAEEKEEENTFANIFPILSYVWAGGVLLMLLYSVISFVRLKRRVRASFVTDKNIYICDDISTPFILGIIKPRIYLPSALSGEELEYITSHEKAHLKRLDHLWKPLGFVLLSVHWFNPLMWISYILLCRDIELACDEKVLKSLGTDSKKHYSQTLLTFSTERKLVSACPLAFGEVGVKQRIKNILNYKKPAFWVILLSLLLCLAIGLCFLTNPVSNKDETKETTETGSNQYILVNSKKIPLDEVLAQIPDTINNELYYGGNYTESNNMFSNKDLILNKSLNYKLYSYYPSTSPYDSVLDAYLPEVRLVFTDLEHPLSTDEDPQLYYTTIKVTENGLQSQFFSGNHISKTETPGTFLGNYSLFISEVEPPKHEVMSDDWKANTEKALRLYMDKNDFWSHSEDNLEIGNYKVYIKGFSKNDTDTKIIFEHENGNVYEGFYYFVHHSSGNTPADLNHVKLQTDIYDLGYQIYLDRVKQNAAFTMEYEIKETSNSSVTLPEPETEEGYIDYTYQDESALRNSNIRLYPKSKTFEFFIHSLSSLLPTGNYEIENSKLILKTEGVSNQTYVFNIIDSDNLEFIESDSSPIPTFKLSASEPAKAPFGDKAVFSKYSGSYTDLIGNNLTSFNAILGKQSVLFSSKSAEGYISGSERLIDINAAVDIPKRVYDLFKNKILTQTTNHPTIDNLIFHFSISDYDANGKTTGNVTVFIYENDFVSVNYEMYKCNGISKEAKELLSVFLSETEQYYTVKSHDFNYTYEIKKSDGTIIESRTTSNRQPHITHYPEDNLISVMIQSGTGSLARSTVFYNTETGEIFKSFYGIVEYKNGLVVSSGSGEVTITNLQKPELKQVINEFDKPISTFVENIWEVDFTEDFTKVKVGHYSGEYQNGEEVIKVTEYFDIDKELLLPEN